MLDVGCSAEFMGSLLSFFSMHWDHEPTPNPSEGGELRAGAMRQFPSWEGSGVGRFMERTPRTFCAPCAHEAEAQQSSTRDATFKGRAGVREKSASFTRAIPRILALHS